MVDSDMSNDQKQNSPIEKSSPVRWLLVLAVLGASVAVTMMVSSRNDFEIALLSWCAGAGGCHLVNYARWT